VLAVLGGHVGAAPFVAALHRVDPAALALALVVTAVTTLCCARRWMVVSSSLGAEPVPLGPAVAAYYRSQLLNATLPGGVLGDLHRGLSHRLGGGAGTGLRAVAWERSAGMVVQVVVTALGVLVWLAGPPAGPASAGALAAAVVGGLVVLGAVPRRVRTVCVLSVVAYAGHVLLFVVAARTVGVDLATATLVPAALVALLASTLPTSIAGWGPREGAAAWAFAESGLTAADGVTVSVVYGVMALVAVLPGLAVLAAVPRGGGRHG